MGAGASATGGTSAPNPKAYKWTSNSTLQGPWTFRLKEKVQCTCEGAKWCSREDPAKQKGLPSPIQGLHANWIGDTGVLAMARPWKSFVEKYNLVQVFQQQRIGMILNLQEVGEHASCGPGNLPSCGFSYEAEPFMAAGVGVYNFSWRDMGVPTLDRMMDIVQVMDHVTRVEGRRIAVHCHAGLGRTGLSIACFMVFAGTHNAAAAVKEVRKYRRGSVQTSRQVQFVSIFEQYILHLRCLFHASPAVASPRKHNPGPQSSAAAPSAGTPASRVSGSGPVEVKVTGGMRTEVYSSGLTMVGPVKVQGQAAKSADLLTEDDAGLASQPPPWSESFHIEPSRAKDFVPRPPHTYEEALRRQARAIHGTPRRVFVRMHRFVKEAFFYMIREATEAQASASAHATLPHSPQVVAEVLALLINHHSVTHVDEAALQPLLSHPAWARLIGPTVDTEQVFAKLGALISQLNDGQYECFLQTSPGLDAAGLHGVAGPALGQAASACLGHTPGTSGTVAAAGPVPGWPAPAPAEVSMLTAIMALERFFGTFTTPSISTSGLAHVAKTFDTLFEDHTSSPAHMPTATTSGPSHNGVATPTDPAQLAFEVLHALSGADQELLLVCTALLRLVAQVSGPECESSLVVIGRWLVRLLLGSLASVNAAEEAVLSFLWWLAGIDTAYAVLLMLKKHRDARLRSSPKAMLATLSESLLQDTRSPSPTPMAAGADASGHAASHAASDAQQQQPDGLATAAYMQACQDAYAGANPAAMAHGPPPDHNQVPFLPPMEGLHMQAPQFAQFPASYFGYPTQLPQPPGLASQLNGAYRDGFREVFAGVQTVVYPPPFHSGHVEIHDVWK